MALILSIETSTKVCSVALHQDGELLGSQELHVDRSHSEYLAIMIKDMLKYCSVETKELSAVAVSKGPGSYTGLRIGVSTAKGLCFGLDIPLISVNSLLAMAFEASKYNLNQYDLCPMLDARRMEVYCLLTDHQLNLKQETHSRILEEASFEKELKDNQILFFGNGMPKSRDMLGKNGKAFFIEDIYPKACNIGYLAFEKFKNEDFENTVTFEPFYLKDFIATKPRKLL
ncbi:MAG: tRNA (adenosine(37)-N6)-threonylcarbamoyltransferase complex dimerization subunit type 1 TsaB [Cyclobacteriaceae bacterium]|jgi:tRNA threonylcarbamoyladenosine biosynthesis protein TsaB